jgi:hydroxypyruvate isomerase
MIIRRKPSASGCKRNGLTQALFNLPPGNWDAGEKGFAALPDRFDDLQQSLHTALPYAQATGVKRLHLMAGIATAAIRKAWRRFTNRWRGPPSSSRPTASTS